MADSSNATIRKITPARVVTTLAGLAAYAGSTDGTGSAARFYQPTGVAVDNTGNVYVADYLNDTIRKITPGGVVDTFAGLAGTGGWRDGTGSAALFSEAQGVTVDNAGDVFVADGNGFVREITPAGIVTTLGGWPPSLSARGITVDNSGNIFVADTFNHAIRQVTPAGVVTTLAGSVGNKGSADGTGSVARFNYPYGLAADSAGNIYVADTDNRTIRKIAAGGVVTTLAGLAGNEGSIDGATSVARFRGPRGVAVDAVGNVYVADTANDTIRKIIPGGVVTTLAGLASSQGSTR